MRADEGVRGRTRANEGGRGTRMFVSIAFEENLVVLHTSGGGLHSNVDI